MKLGINYKAQIYSKVMTRFHLAIGFGSDPRAISIPHWTSLRRTMAQ